VVKDVSGEDVYQARGQVMHPAIYRSLVELVMVKDTTVEHDKVTLTLALPFMGIPIKDYFVNSLRYAVTDLGAEAEGGITEMNQEERQAFLSMEQQN
jgi:metal-sulfur cluster biosynthetic enzyme